jgi:hypothetical protein
MITEWFVGFIVGGVATLLTFALPTADHLDISIPSGIVQGYSILDHVVPMDLLVLLIGVVTAFKVAVAGGNVVFLFVNLIRGSGARI